MVHKTPLRLLLLASIALSGLAEATIVRMDLSWGGRPAEAVYIELYDAEAPVTVSNFLAYIDSGGERRYDGSFLHRSVPGFIIQGGGFAYDPALGDFGVSSAPHIPVYDPIVNEYSASRSNLRGTIAMAKLGGDPDSATSEWFFNLADNSGNLDSQNGGFTVFGRVLGDGMDVIDAIEALDISDLGGVFSALPLDRADPGDPVTTSTLVVVERMVIDPPANLRLPGVKSIDIPYYETFTGDLPFGNDGSGDLVFSTGAPAFSFTGTNAAEFSITGTTCERVAPNEQCTATLAITPLAPGILSATLVIRTNDPDTPEATLDLSITASSDADGISNSVEVAAPNGGDGNNDGIPDAEQENVASLPDPDGHYITVESDPGTRLVNVGSATIPSDVVLPTALGASLRFTGHLHSFTIKDVPVGGTAKAILHLANNQANTYFKYNPNAFLENWYRFDYNPRTGTGAVIEGNRITLHFVDGAAGDLDGVANGIIVDPGSPAILTPDDISSSGGGGCSLSKVTNSSPQKAIDFILLLLGLLVVAGLRVQRKQLRSRHCERSAAIS